MAGYSIKSISYNKYKELINKQIPLQYENKRDYATECWTDMAGICHITYTTVDIFPSHGSCIICIDYNLDNGNIKIAFDNVALFKLNFKSDVEFSEFLVSNKLEEYYNVYRDYRKQKCILYNNIKSSLELLKLG